MSKYHFTKRPPLFQVHQDLDTVVMKSAAGFNPI